MLDLCLLSAEQILQQWNFSQPWSAADAAIILLLKQSAEDIAFSLSKANHLLNALLANDGLVDTADAGCPILRGDFDLHLQAHVTVVVDRWCDFHVDANIKVLKLRIHIGICRGASR